MRTTVFLLLSFLPLTAWATTQMPDIVRLDGRNYELSFQIRSNALSIYDCKERKVSALPWPHTALRRGYVGVWEIREGTLLLVEVRQMFGENSDQVTNRFAELFPGHETGLLASWFTGVLRLNEPGSESFASDPTDMAFAKEVHVGVVDGRITSCQYVDNSKAVRERRKRALEEQERKYRQLRAQPVEGPNERQ